MKTKFNSMLMAGVVLATAFTSCKKEKDLPPVDQNINTIPEFFLPAPEPVYGSQAPGFFVAANANQKINIPQDLDFHPMRNMELWVINKDDVSTGGSTVIVSNAGKTNQTSEWRRDGNTWHFMSNPSAMAFSSNGYWASTANVRDANHTSNGTFTGPTLWSSDMNIYAKPSGGNGSHMDMLHGSPFGMGIASEKDNIFWVFDGYNGHLVRYDFASDHGPGNDDHSDGKIHRYQQVSLKRVADVPGHLVLDAAKKWLYIVDNGNHRILRVNIQTGTKYAELPDYNEPLAEHWSMTGLEWEVFIETGFVQASGVEIKDNRLFISDYETGDIIAVNINDKKEIGRIKTGNKGVAGIKIDPEGRLWFVNALKNEVVRVDPK